MNWSYVLLAASAAVTVAGSTSAGTLMQALAEGYGGAQVQSIGTTAGLAAVVAGTAQVAAASRELTEAERAAGLQAYPVAVDTLAIVVSPDVKTGMLTRSQLAKIFSGQMKYWSDGRAITVISREAGSGTRDSFESLVGTVTPDALVCDGSGFVRLLTESRSGAIGYVSAAILQKNDRTVKIDGLGWQDADYPLRRSFYLVNAGDGMDFVRFAQSAEGQAIVRAEGYLCP